MANEVKEEGMISILEYEDKPKNKYEKIPNGWVATADELRLLKFKSYTRVFDGEEKTRYLIEDRGKVYDAPNVVMSKIRKAINEPGLIRVQLTVSGKDKATRYELTPYMKG
jgi:hypothetical protein